MDGTPKPTWWKRAIFARKHLDNYVEQDCEILSPYVSSMCRAIAQDLVMNIEKRTVRKEEPAEEVKE